MSKIEVMNTEYIGEWESIYNPNFNYTEFGTIKNAAGSNNFVLSTKQWILQTNATGIIAKSGRYGGTYAHRDIAYHFGMWISPKFQLLMVKEYQRLKAAEQAQLGWSVKRELSKINYFKPSAATKFTWALSRRKVKRYEVAPLPYPHRRCQTELDSCDAHTTRNFLRLCQ
ncbi:MAG: KilA-N domain-containing protein [Fibrobacter sp.]|nr:KilA-N domain-containing protein [Fibrobacter sp.]